MPSINDASEKKTKRVSLVLKPSDYENFKKICDLKGIPVNIVINNMIVEFIRNNRELLSE